MSSPIVPFRPTFFYFLCVTKQAQLEVWHHERYAEQQQEHDREHGALVAENERLQGLLLRSQQMEAQPLRSGDMNVTKSSSSSSTSYFAAAVRPSVAVATAPMPLAFPVPPSVSVHTMHVHSSATEEEKGKDNDDYYRTQQDKDRQGFTNKSQYQYSMLKSMVGGPQSGSSNQDTANNNVDDLGAILASEVAALACEAASVDSAVDKVTMAGGGVNFSVGSDGMLRNRQALSSSSSSSSSLPMTMASSVATAAGRVSDGSTSDNAASGTAAAAAASSRSSLAALLATADVQIRTLGVRSRSPSPPPPPHAAYAAAATVTAAASTHHSYVKSANAPAPILNFQLPTAPSSSSSSRRFADASSPVVPRLSTLLKATSDVRTDPGTAVSTTTEGSSLEEVEDEIRRRLRNIGAALSPERRRTSPTTAVTAAAAVSRNASSALGWGLLKKSLEMQEAEEAPTRPSPSQRQLQAASTYMALHSAHNRTKAGTPPSTHTHRGGHGGRSTSASPSSSSSRISPGFSDRKPLPLPAGSPLTRSTGHASSTVSMFRRGSPDIPGSTTAAAAAAARGARSTTRSSSPVMHASSATSTTVQNGRRPKPPSMSMSPSSLANESRLDDFLGKLGRYIDEQDAEVGNDGDDGDDNTSEDSLLDGLHVAFPNPQAPVPPQPTGSAHISEQQDTRQQKKDTQAFQEESDESYETPDSIVGSMLGHPTTT